MKQNNNEQIVFYMFEDVATESIAEARNATPMKKLMGAIRRREIADKARNHLREILR